MPYARRAWRLVEAQHRVSTLKLVGDLAEQSVLEQLIEDTKPVIPQECRHLDYLLATPFRYGSIYPRGTRFRRAGRTAGVFYASERDETAVAELAFHRLLFFLESPATPWPDAIAEFTAFAVSLRTDRGLDLTVSPLAGHSGWTALEDYAACQALADAARATNVALIRYLSVRDPGRGANVAVLACQAFAIPRPVDRRTWRMKFGPAGVQAICEFPVVRLGFDRAAFAADPRIASLDWTRARQ